MNSARQFWVLFKFQALLNPFIWFLPLAFSFPLLLPTFGDYGGRRELSFFDLTFDPFLCGMGIFAAMILAPERLFIGMNAANAAPFGSEFILTRAVDRHLVYRARAAFLYLLMLFVPLGSFVYAVQHTNLVVREYSPAIQQQALASAPGSTLLPPEMAHGKPTRIAIPRGQLLAAEYQSLTPLLLLCAMQLLVLVLHPLRYAKVIFWCLYVGMTFAPFLNLPSFHSSAPSMGETAFFFLARHELAVLTATAAVFVATQLVCERWFARMEF